MENIDDQQIESYLRGKMTLEERGVFEALLATDPELRNRTEALHHMAEGIRQVARTDIRKRLEAQQDKIKQEERGGKGSSTNWGKSIVLLSIGMLLGLCLGWFLFREKPAVPPSNVVENREGLEVATPEHEEIATVRIPSPKLGNKIQMTVLHDPDLEDRTTGKPARIYALDRGGVGLCMYVRSGDDFWKNHPLELHQSGTQYFLQIGTDKYLLLDDGEEHPFPETPIDD